MQDWIVFHCLSLGPSFWFIPRHSRRIWCSVCSNWLENTIAADPNITTWTHSRTVLPLWLATPCCFLCSDVRLGPTSISCPHQCAWKPREIQPGLVEYIISWVTLRHGTLTVCNGECGFRTLGQCVFRCRPNKTQRFLMHLSHWDVFFSPCFIFLFNDPSEMVRLGLHFCVWSRVASEAKMPCRCLQALNRAPMLDTTGLWNVGETSLRLSIYSGQKCKFKHAEIGFHPPVLLTLQFWKEVQGSRTWRWCCCVWCSTFFEWKICTFQFCCFPEVGLGCLEQKPRDWRQNILEQCCWNVSGYSLKFNDCWVMQGYRANGHDVFTLASMRCSNSWFSSNMTG